MADDAPLFSALRAMWQTRDPMPPGLVDEIIVALETAHLAEEYRELLLVSDARELAGVRGAAPRVLEFGAQAVHLMLRIDGEPGRHRIDGWLAPPRAGRATLEVDGIEVATVPISPEGRFEFPTVPSGACRLVIHSDGEGGHTVTGDFTI